MYNPRCLQTYRSKEEAEKNMQANSYEECDHCSTMPPQVPVDVVQPEGRKRHAAESECLVMHRAVLVRR